MIDEQIRQHAERLTAHSEVLRYQTSAAPQFLDITDEVAKSVAGSGVYNGIAVIYSRHTTAAVKINENEPELIKDMTRFLSEIAPTDREYSHNNFDVRTVNMEEDECPNAHSHCQHLTLSASESVPVIAGRLALGRYQRIFLIELDRPKARQITVQVVGI